MFLDMTRTAVIYTRISRDPEHNELGVARQRQDCEALAEREHLEVLEVLTDDDRSAYTGKRRPGYERLRELLRDGAVDTVVAWHPDRLTRHPRELEELIEALESAGATVRTVQAGELDLSTPAGRMTARVVGAVARHESEHKSARLRRKHDEIAQAGRLAGGGPRPFGYDDDRVTLRPAEAEVVRDMVRRVLAGESLRSIATDVNRRQIQTSVGKSWTTSAVRRLVMSPRIAGLRQHRTGTYQAVWPAIITMDEHRRVAAMMNDNTRHGAAPARRYLLTGFLFCSMCDSKLVARPRGDKRRCYVCAAGTNFHGCGKIRTLSEPLEELVVAAVLEVLADLDMTQEPTPHADTTVVLAELADIERRQQELGTMWAAGEIDRAGWQAASRAMHDRRRALEAEVARHGRAEGVRVAVDAAMASRWPSLSFDQQRAVIGRLVERIVVAPAVKGRNRFDPNRVTIVWRA